MFLRKTIFFPIEGILVIGDLHLGYEYMIQQSGILIPDKQTTEIIEELKAILISIKEKDMILRKIIFIGDIKHSFSYQKKEKNYFKEIIEFLKKYVTESNIILIKGNHDTIDYSNKGKLKNYYIYKGILFTHGHEFFPEILDKKIKTIVMGHLHPSILLSDKQEIKKEKYKCFLVGNFKSKTIIILPSFLTIVEGTMINNLEEEYEDYFSIIPKKRLSNFEVYVIGEDGVYNFGKVKSINF